MGDFSQSFTQALCGFSAAFAAGAPFFAAGAAAGGLALLILLGRLLRQGRAGRDRECAGGQCRGMRATRQPPDNPSRLDHSSRILVLQGSHLARIPLMTEP
jgi:hypothetical protein